MAEQPPAADGQPPAHVERQPDYGNIVHVDCRRCGASNVLDPARMQPRKGGRVHMTCASCELAFRVRRRDIARPAPDTSVASLYTVQGVEAPSFWTRLRRRS